ncbi:MAG: CopD family protein [Paracoccaceae bacterium]|nr:CopD family protein [Paracoccaceae bacterium]
MPDAWGIATIGAKWLLYLGVLGASGTVFCALIFNLARVRRLAVGWALVGLVGAGLTFALKGVALTGNSSGMTDPEMLGLLWQTQSGTSLMLQVTGLAVVILGLGLGRVGLVLSALGGVLALASFAVLGHVQDRGSWGLVAVLLVHLTGIAFWIGILTPLRRLASDIDALTEAAELGHRFGQAALVMVPLLLLAGGIMTYALAGSVTAMISTAYGQTLLFKIAVVALLLGLAAANKLRFVPGLQAGDATAARHLTRSITLEWVAILVILAATAILTTTLPLPT